MRASAVLLAAIVLIAVALITTGNGYETYVIVMVGLTAIAGTGLNVVVGMTGQISLGHVGFYAIGAYVVGVLTTTLGWSFWPALPAAAALAGLAGLLLAIPALRVRGPYLAMVTIAFGFVIEQSAAEWKALTGGWNGLSGIPAPALFGWSFSERDIAYFTLALAVFSTVLYGILSTSVWGRAMRAVRDSEIASASIGLDAVSMRATAFAISAALTGTAGGVFASTTNFISPESFPFLQSILFLLAVMVGGVDSVFGPWIGASIVVLVPESLSWVGQYQVLFVGVLMLAVLWVAPSGVSGLIGSLWARCNAVASAGIDRLPAKGHTESGVSRVDVSAFLSAGVGVGASLAVRDLSLTFGGVKALDGLSFDARPGEITSVIGPNGAGKSTALNLICGFYRAVAGSVRLGDQEITGLASHRIARIGIARTYQTSQLFSSMSVAENVLMGLRRGRLGAGAFIATENDRTSLDQVESVLAFVGYRGPMNRPAGALSFVDRRLVEIARALATRPALIALDEPAAGLDAADKATLKEALRRIAKAGIAVVLVEHDIDLVMGLSNRVVVLDAGTKIAEGPPERVASDSKVIEAYLGARRAVDLSRDRPLASVPTPLLHVEGVTAGYGAATIVRGISLTIGGGELVTIIGANGAGKTTLMRALSGLLRPTAGGVSLQGERIVGLSADRVAARGLVMVPEGRQVFPELSVIDNLRLGGFARGTKDQAALLESLLARFPQLHRRRNQRAGSLSGGEQQLLAIARGLMAMPRVMLLDEPSLGLAPKILEEVYALLAELRNEGTTILLVDQVAALALSVADRAYVLQSGVISRSGNAAEMARDPALAHSYVGSHGRPQ
jgi:branched-chain amino acid transport system ATP-binding protein